jgi:peptide/nickel transport system permease protein
LLQSVPAAALGLCLLASGARGAPACAAALSLVLYPRLVQYVLNLVETAATAPHILTARAKGAKPIRILARHVMPATLPQLASLAGVSVGMAASAAIPLEAILDIAGLGQLAWQAALARDLNLLVNLTVLLTLLVTVANGLAELAQARAATSMERSV